MSTQSTCTAGRTERLTVSPTPLNPFWQQTMLRIKDPSKSLPFYTDILGLQHVMTYKFPEMGFDLYFLASLGPDAKVPEINTPAAEELLWNSDNFFLELTHNYGTEGKPDFKYASGNEEPKRGFGHIAIFTDDVYATCDDFEKRGVSFKKKPDEGRMKGLAFCYDPDGYWIEIIRRSEKTPLPYFNLSQTMIRVKDPKPALEFYGRLGMSLVAEKHFGPDRGDFSLYFLYSLPAGFKLPPSDSEEAFELMKTFTQPCIELTHNHGTESDADFSYFTAGEGAGFGHTGFIVDDLEAACKMLEAAGVPFKKRPSDGKMKNLAFVLDTDGYWVEIIQRGTKFLK
jgi:lactoylglutathione lyase